MNHDYLPSLKNFAPAIRRAAVAAKAVPLLPNCASLTRKPQERRQARLEAGLTDDGFVDKRYGQR